MFSFVGTINLNKYKGPGVTVVLTPPLIYHKILPPFIHLSIKIKSKDTVSNVNYELWIIILIKPFYSVSLFHFQQFKYFAPYF
jgi:hypothetical protein